MTEKSLQCPSQEVLLDYAYGEEMPQVTSHLAECEKCRGFVGRERRLNQLLDGYCETPSGLAEGISQACRDEMDEEEFLAPKPPIAAPRRALFEYVLKVAALVAVIAGAFFYIGRQSAYLGGDAVAASTETPVSVDSLFIDEVAPRAVASIPRAPARAYTSPRLDTGVELSGKTADPSQGFSLRDSQAFVASQTQNPRQNVTMASSNGADSLRGQHGASLAKVHDEVTHVWLADELPSPERIQSLAMPLEMPPPMKTVSSQSPSWGPMQESRQLPIHSMAKNTGSSSRQTIRSPTRQHAPHSSEPRSSTISKSSNRGDVTALQRRDAFDVRVNCRDAGAPPSFTFFLLCITTCTASS